MIYGAVEAGGTKTVCAIADGAGALRARLALPTERPDQTFPRIRAFFEEHISDGHALAAIGVAAFGPVDINPRSPSYGAILATPKPHWSGANFRDALTDLAPKIVVDTDVNGAGLGEWLYGAGRGVGTLAYVTVGTGIGAGVLTNGHALSGFSHYEMGHIRPGRDCADPFRGCCPYHGDCLEGLASGPAIAARWGAPLNALTDPDARAAAGDLEARYLAHLAWTLIVTHAPERIVFGGGVMKAPGLIDALRAHTRALVGDYLNHPVLAGDLSGYIVAPALGDDAGVTGAAALARRVARADASGEDASGEDASGEDASGEAGPAGRAGSAGAR